MHDGRFGPAAALLRARHLGLRLDQGDRRSREPHLHGSEHHGPPAGHTRRYDHLRLHRAQLLAQARTSGGRDADHGDLRSGGPPRLPSTGSCGSTLSDRKRIATLTIRGSVIPRKKSVEELYPVDAGGGLRLTSTTCVFTYVYPGIRAQSAVSCINTSDRAITVELRPDPGSGAGCCRPRARNGSKPACTARSTSRTSFRRSRPATAPCATPWSCSSTGRAAAW